jgi:hypothetical protein
VDETKVSNHVRKERIGVRRAPLEAGFDLLGLLSALCILSLGAEVVGSPDIIAMTGRGSAARGVAARDDAGADVAPCSAVDGTFCSSVAPLVLCPSAESTGS